MTGARFEDVAVVDIGGTKTRIGHVRGGVPAARFDTFDSRLLAVDRPHAVLAREIRAHAAIDGFVPAAVVLGIPGMIDRERDVVSSCNNVPTLHGSHLRRGLAAALGCPVALEQDIMLQLLGERRAGAARGRRSVFGAYFGTGIGSAWLQGGDPLRGDGASLQAGHIPVAAEGRPCACGNTDCVEAYAGGHVLRALAERHDVPLGELFLRGGDAALARELERFVTWQAFLLATVRTLLGPDLVVIGGGIPAMAGYPRDALVERAMRQLQRPRPAPSAVYAYASLGDAASLHGALSLLEHVEPTGD